ncbi:MAG: HNH endonuclease [Bacilli bacterium]|nr:HNH endonuclease [Bacilli bacterium]
MKVRRKKRVHHDWAKEITKGNVIAFYKSTDWDIAREKRLEVDKYACQFFLGNYDDGIHKSYKIQLKKADTVHHKIPVKERPDLALDLNNLVSLSFEAHEIIEDRHRFYFRRKKKPLTEEKW